MSSNSKPCTNTNKSSEIVSHAILMQASISIQDCCVCAAIATRQSLTLLQGCAGMPRLSCLLRAARQSQATKSLSAFAINATQTSVEPQVGAAQAWSRVISTGSKAALLPVHIEDEPYCRQRQLITLGNRVSAALAPACCIFRVHMPCVTSAGAVAGSSRRPRYVDCSKCRGHWRC